jgi:L-fucose isomerase-like protein
MAVTLKPVKLGFLPANRAFFSSALAAKSRKQAVDVLQGMGVEVVVPNEQQTKVGCVGTIEEAEICAKLFRKQDVDGIVIGAVNFGDEQSVAWTVRQARLDVPILIFGGQEEETLRMTTARRDSFCGLLSIGEALRQLGVKYSIARTPICSPEDASFRKDVDWFTRVCRVVGGVRNARYGQVGARPDAFWTCRFDEKQLQRLGPTTVSIDLSEVIAGASRLQDDDPEVQATAKSIRAYADTSAILDRSTLRSAKLELWLKRWGEQNRIDAFAIQCWTSIQQNFGVCSCTTMSRFGEDGKPSACEADVLGALSMHAVMLASGTPAALADWNNLHNEDDELVNVWHCGVFPASFAKGKPSLGAADILIASGGAPREDAEGTVHFVAKPGPLTLSRVTQDPGGAWKAVVAHGDIEDNPATTFGTYGWCRIPHLQDLYRNVLLRHFPHHVAMTQGSVGDVLWEAFGNYLGFEVYHSLQATPGLYTDRSPF